mgnify:CR=1 FL=1
MKSNFKLQKLFGFLRGKRISPFVLLLFCSINLFAQGEKKIRFGIDNHFYTIIINSINNNEYFFFEERKPKKQPHIVSDIYAYSFGNYQIQFLPGSVFFVLLHQDRIEMIFQLSRPVLIFNEKLLIPFRSFLSCLSSCGMFDSSGSDLAISFKTKTNFSMTHRVGKQQEKQFNIKSDDTNPNSSFIESPSKKQEYNFSEFTFPKVLLTEKERFSLKKEPFAIQEFRIKQSITKPRLANDTMNVPPKFYVLPPELKNSSK